jgi:hypothetical protein
MPPARDDAKRIAHEIRVAGFQRCRNVGHLPFLSVEIIGGIKSCRLWDYGSPLAYCQAKWIPVRLSPLDVLPLRSVRALWLLGSQGLQNVP